MKIKKIHILTLVTLFLMLAGFGITYKVKEMKTTNGLGIILPELDSDIVIDPNKTLHRRQASWIVYDFEKTVEKSSYIVRGKVMEKGGTQIYNHCDSKGVVVGQTAYHEVQIEVLEALKGAEKGDTITYLELGGETEDAIYIYEDIVPLNVGEEYLFFLNEHGAFLDPATVISISDGHISPSSRLIPGNSSNTYGAKTRILVDDYMETIKAELE